MYIFKSPGLPSNASPSSPRTCSVPKPYLEMNNWGYIGIVEKKRETTISGLGFTGLVQGTPVVCSLVAYVFWGLLMKAEH